MKELLDSNSGVRHAMEGTSTKPDGGALLTISQTLCGLMGGLVNSLEEFQNVGKALEIVNCSLDEPQTSASADHLRVVAGALKEMVGKLVSDMKAGIKGDAEVQKILPIMQKCSGANHHAFFQDLMVSNQRSCIVDISPPSEDTYDLRMVKRAAGKGQVMCKHVCEHHPELLDRWLWRKLPHEVVEFVLARLPLSCIIEICENSKGWSKACKSSSFRVACAENQPQLFGLLRWDCLEERMWTSVHDTKAKEWSIVELATLPETLPETLPDYDWDESYDYRSYLYQNSMCACDGGLVCFVPGDSLATSRIANTIPILVCNPLTSIWKTLPLPDGLEITKIIMVQLVVEDGTQCYRVILVMCENIGEACAAHCYSSKTGKWSILDHGLVHGIHRTLLRGSGVPYVFDCATKTLFDLTDCISYGDLAPIAYSMAKDHLFVLYLPNYLTCNLMYAISEYEWDSSESNLKELNYSESGVEAFSHPYKEKIFASCGFVFLIVDNGEEVREKHHQLIFRCDVSANDWDFPPPLVNTYASEVEGFFMCELRWDITP